MCARSCAHIYDVRKRKGVVVYLNVNNNNDIQNNDIYIFLRKYAEGMQSKSLTLSAYLVLQQLSLFQTKPKPLDPILQSVSKP